jgi:hypothetical protein
MNQPAGKADDRTARLGPGSHNLRQVLATDDVLLRDVVERLTRIPDSFRDFSVTPTDARKVPSRKSRSNFLRVSVIATP